jgi:1-deoxy-D-xylulose-5-phosphate reductoisomerase
MKNIAILGSTGSIGRQALEVIRMHKDHFHVSLLAVRSDTDLLERQAEEFQPDAVAVSDSDAGKKWDCRLHGSIRVFCGADSMDEAVRESAADIVLVAVTGIDGLRPTLAALESGKKVALANKESLVSGGELVMKKSRGTGIDLFPVDSEHSAIFQCLQGQDRKAVRKLILTASGGPFRGWSEEKLSDIAPEQCFHHPTWNMGRKVTMDSATMFNKGLEIMEAHWLFNVPYEKIEVLVQPQSLIHSMVEYEDGAVMAQIGNPDMRIPIQLALTYPDRMPTPSRTFVDWSKLSSIILEEPDTAVFRSIPMAYQAGQAGGDATTAYNAANEQAVHAFLEGKINFPMIFNTVESVLEHWDTKPVRSVDDIMDGDKRARRAAEKYIAGIHL